MTKHDNKESLAASHLRLVSGQSSKSSQDSRIRPPRRFPPLYSAQMVLTSHLIVQKNGQLMGDALALSTEVLDSILTKVV